MGQQSQQIINYCPVCCSRPWKRYSVSGFTAAETTAGGGLGGSCCVLMHGGKVSSKPSNSVGLSNVDSFTRVKINANNYLLNAENSVICGLPNTL